MYFIFVFSCYPQIQLQGCSMELFPLKLLASEKGIPVLRLMGKLETKGWWILPVDILESPDEDQLARK